MKYRHILLSVVYVFMVLFSSCSKKNYGRQETFKNYKQTPTRTSLMPAMPKVHTPSIGKHVPSSMPSPIKKSALKKPPSKPLTPNSVTKTPLQKMSLKKHTTKHSSHSSLNPNEIDFDVENTTGKTLYVSCFAWQRKHKIHNWRWDKTDVYTIKPGQTITIDVDTIPDPQDRQRVFAYLAVHDNKQDADNATYELLEDRNKLDLDQLVKLKGKKVTLMIEKYGFKGELFEYDFVEKKKDEESIPELDFAVENKTGKTILVTCFVYMKKAKGSWLAAEEKKDDMAIWRFDKTPLLKIKPGDIGIIDVDTIPTARDRSYMRAALAVFEEFEEKEAREATYELVETRRKLNLGDINQLKNRKVIVEIERYGFLEDFIDYIVKPIRRIDFKALKR